MFALKYCRTIRPSFQRYWGRTLLLLLFIGWVLVTSKLIVSLKTKTLIAQESIQAIDSTHEHTLVTKYPGELDIVSRSRVNYENQSRKRSISCQKKTNVAFLKVHKAGSSTVTNIFLRFAIRNKLNIVLPRRSDGFGFNYLGYGVTLDRRHIIPIPGNNSYNILCNHVIYNRKAFRSIMPENTLLIGILREPVSQFLSAAHYFGFAEHLERNASLSGYHNMSFEALFGKYVWKPDDWTIETFFVRNRMSADFGLPEESFADSTYFETFLRNIDEDFSLVMLMEYFDESVVLMKRILCWKLQDIIYLPLNVRKQKRKLVFRTGILRELKKWNRADVRLYEHFSKKFWNQVHIEGPDFFLEVRRYRNAKEQLTEFCNGWLSKETSNITIESSDWNEEFSVGSVDCNALKREEMETMKDLIHAAWQRYHSATDHS